MNRKPKSRYSKEFRTEAVKLIVEGGVSAYEASRQLNRVKQELAQVKQEHDILKKAATYFARESLPGTR